MRLPILTGVVIIATCGAAMAQGISGAIGIDYTNSSAPGNEVDTTTVTATARVPLSERFKIDFGVGYSNMDAYGSDFGATSITVEPSYDVTPNLSVGAYFGRTTTTTPANFDPFNRVGVKVDYGFDDFRVAAYYGGLNGSNVPSAGTNTSAGLAFEYDISPRLQIYGDYDRDIFDFRGMDVTGTFFGVRWVVFDGISSAVPAELDLAVGRMDINGIDYDQLRFGVTFPLGNTNGGGEGVCGRDTVSTSSSVCQPDPFRSVALRHTFSF